MTVTVRSIDMYSSRVAIFNDILFGGLVKGGFGFEVAFILGFWLEVGILIWLGLELENW